MSLALLLVLACSHVARSVSDSAFPDAEQDFVYLHGCCRVCIALADLSGSGLFLCRSLHQSHSHFSVVQPVRVDDVGRFLSHAVSHRPAADTRVFYRLQHGDRELLLNLTLNPHLLSQDHVVETRQGGPGTGNGTGQRVENACHLLGTVTDGRAQGTAAVSTCNGLVSTTGHSVEIYS
ncbi:hypothetical protein MHYP_G00263160 [Metynnis hypsauchen]